MQKSGIIADIPTLRGYGLLCATLLSALSLWITSLNLGASLLIWLVALSGLGRLAKRARMQAGTLLGIGCVGLAWGWWSGVSVAWQDLLHSNTQLLAMLIAVSFLALIASPRPTSKQRELPIGKVGLWNTLLANHLFGAVINISSVIVIGERLRRVREIDLPLGSVLSVSFGLASLWSPFFAAMAYTLTLIPNMSVLTVMAIGLPMAALGIGLLYWVNRKHSGALAGYPLAGRSLLVPLALGCLVIVAHEVWPHVGISSIIVVAALLLVSIILTFEKRFKTVHAHCHDRLGQFINEPSIFLAAGVFSTGIGLALQTVTFALPFSQYGPLEASITLVLSMMAARLGVHAIIIMALLNPILQTIDPPANLLAATYLAIWGLGMGFNPVSGTLLTVQGAFGLQGSRLANYNTPLVFLLVALCCGNFWLMSAWLPMG